MALDTVRAEYDTGKSFVSETRDVFGRPVLIITASKHNIGKTELTGTAQGIAKTFVWQKRS